MICLGSCEKGKEEIIVNCNNLVPAFAGMESLRVKNEINKLTADLEPNPTEDDKIGHRENVNILINRINSNCESLHVGIGCYACILTYPAQTEIILVNTSNPIVSWTIDIRTPENDVMSFVRVH